MKRTGKKRLSLSKSKRRKENSQDEVEESRFSFKIASEIEKLKKKVIPPNTGKATQWAVKAFTDWANAREIAGEEKPPDDILLSNDEDIICEWLCLFFVEARKSNGTPYCPRSLSSLLSGIHRYIESNSSHQVKITNTDGPFKPLHTLLENQYKILHKQGVGAQRVQAAVISFDQEEQLWGSEVFNTATADGLLNAVFYYNGINFVLRGGDEHRSLSVAQFEFCIEQKSPNESVECVYYTEFGSKNRPGGKKQINLEPKRICQYAQPHLGEKCHVYLLKKYISLLQPTVDKSAAFYYKPLKNILPDEPWYTSTPLGHNKLDKMLKEIFNDGDLDSTNISNHSLRATSITRMYQASVPEKLIMERSGHLTKEGLRSYEHTSSLQAQSVCNVLAKSVPVEASSMEFNREDTNELKTIQNNEENDSADMKENDGNKANILPPPTIAENPLKGRLSFENMSGCTFNINLSN